MRSHHIEKHRADIIALWQANFGITLEEQRVEFMKTGLAVRYYLTPELAKDRSKFGQPALRSR